MKKTILLFALVITTMAFSQNYGTKWSEKDQQDYVYFNGSFDLNMALGLKDNKDTAEFDDRGLDLDLELGARHKHVGVYIFYGMFDAIEYQNYGGGVDYYVYWFSDYNFDLSLGASYGVVIRDNNFTFGGSHVRAMTTFWITKNIGATAKFQLTQAGDLPNKAFRKEGSIGITFKFNR